MKKGDIIVFKYEGITLRYKVCRSTHGCFLNNESDDFNRKIFTLLKIEDRFAFCGNIIGYTITDTQVDFPEVKTLEDLEKIVNALYQRIIDISTPKFKKGEKVKILPKDGSRSDYPCGYTPTMEGFANTTTIILQVKKMSIDKLDDYMRLEKYEEPFYYVLNENIFSWISAMLEPVSKDKDKKEEINPPKFNIGEKVKIKMLDLRRHYGVYLTSNMLQYCGQEFEIKGYDQGIGLRTEKCDGYAYSLKNIYGWVWSSDMLEKCENTTKHELDTAPWTTSEPRDLSVMQKESVEMYDATKTGSIYLPLELIKTDTNAQVVAFGGIKTTTDATPFKEEKDSNIDYKLNFTVDSLDFKK